MDVRCKNEYCPYRVEDFGASRMWPYKCGSPPGGKAIITETGECETYWYAVATGKAKDIREIPLIGNPHLGPMYRRPEDRMVLVVAAVIYEFGKVLLAKRVSKHAEVDSKWEFPGGTVEGGESPEEALVREIKEELGVDVYPVRVVHTSVNRYTFGTSVVLYYVCGAHVSHFHFELDESCVSDVAMVELEGVSKLQPLKGTMEVVVKLQQLRALFSERVVCAGLRNELWTVRGV